MNQVQTAQAVEEAEMIDTRCEADHFWPVVEPPSWAIRRSTTTTQSPSKYWRFLSIGVALRLG